MKQDEVEKVAREVVAKMRDDYEFGGSEDSDGNLTPGTIDFDVVEKHIVKALNEAVTKEREDWKLRSQAMEVALEAVNKDMKTGDGWIHYETTVKVNQALLDWNANKS